MKLDLLDELIVLGHGSKRSLDCILAVEVPRELSDVEVQAGIRRGQLLFPKTAAHSIPIIRESDLEIFSKSTLTSYEHLELGLLKNGGKNYVALKMSHVLGDAVSMLLWLQSFFGNDVLNAPMELKSFPPKKDTRYRRLGTSAVWPKMGNKSDRRRIIKTTMVLPQIHQKLLNDLFIEALLESIPFTNKAIWIPVNVRKNFWQGFGNGLSRMRIYPSGKKTLPEKISHIRTQKLEAMTSGEVTLPPPGFKLDSKIKKMEYLLWVRRPWADWGSISLSHIIDRNNELPFEEMWGVSNIMPKHGAAMFAFTKREKTYITVTCDYGVSEASAIQLLKSFEQNILQLLDGNTG